MNNSPSGIFLPNPDFAVVPREKLEAYCLNPRHPKGKHKARVFESALGLTADDWEYLKDILLQIVKTHCAVYKGCNEFGIRYEIQFDLKGVNVTSGWLIEKGEDFPRLTSCYIKS